VAQIPGVFSSEIEPVTRKGLELRPEVPARLEWNVAHAVDVDPALVPGPDPVEEMLTQLLTVPETATDHGSLFAPERRGQDVLGPDPTHDREVHHGLIIDRIGARRE
jgi:hypothetical protein